MPFQAVVSCGGICFQIGFTVPIVVLLVQAWKILPPHPNFDLGRFGLVVNIASVLWSGLIIVMLLYGSCFLLSSPNSLVLSLSA